MSLKEVLTNDLKQSMKDKDNVKKSTITLIRAAIKQEEVDKRISLDDEQILDIISAQLKQRKNALSDFEKGGREDLIKQTSKEIEILLSYLPEQLSDEELSQIIKETIDKLGVSSTKDMGKIMGEVMPIVKGRADGKRISSVVKELLT